MSRRRRKRKKVEKPPPTFGQMMGWRRNSMKNVRLIETSWWSPTDNKVERINPHLPPGYDEDEE